MTKPPPDPTLACPYCGKMPEEYVIGARAHANEGGSKMARCKTYGCAIYDKPIYRDRWQRRAGLDTKGPDA